MPRVRCRAGGVERVNVAVQRHPRGRTGIQQHKIK